MRKIDRGKNVTLKKNKDYHLVYSEKPLLNNLIKKDLGEDRLLTFFKTMFVRTFFPQKKRFYRGRCPLVQLLFKILSSLTL